MCWIGPGVLHIAKENIPVFKIVRVSTCSPEKFIRAYFQFSEYKVGKTYDSPIEIRDMFDGNAKISVGLHSYDIRCETKADFQGKPGIRVFLPFKTIFYDTPSFYDTVAILHCVIPEGTIYYVNYNGEYVSNYLNITKLGYVLD